VPDWRGTFNIPAEKCYRAILNYIRAGSIKKKDKVVRSLEPSLIEVKTGIKDGLRIGIIPDGNKSTVLMDFDFSLEMVIELTVNIFLIILFFYSLVHGLGVLAFFIALLISSTLLATLNRENKVRTLYTSKISDLLKYIERIGVIPEFKEEPKPPVDINALYERLIRAYSKLYGRGTRMVERKIQSYMKKGLSREEAIKRLAEKEGFLERYETKPRPKPEVKEKPKPRLPPDILHQRLLYRYVSVYGRSRYALEYEIEELTSLGLSGEKAVKILAEEEGLT